MRDRDVAKISISTIKATSDYCIYCSAKLEDWEKTVDHFIPVCVDSYLANKKENLYVACKECNSVKGAQVFRSLHEAREYILGRYTMEGSARIKYCNRCKGEFYASSFRIKLCDACHSSGQLYIKKTYKSRECKMCKKLFQPRSHNQLYCANPCSSPPTYTYTKKIYKPRQCKMCEKLFQPKTLNHLYCTEACKKRERASRSERE
jgi:hypothetical protein